MNIIAIANQKGGVAKTTTSLALCAGLSHRGFKVLGIDLDPQGNFSSATGVDNLSAPTVYELMKGDTAVETIVQHIQGFDIIPANIMLAGAEQELSRTGKEYCLKEGLSSVLNKYDYIILDTPPSLGILTTTGIKQLNDTVQSVRKYCNPGLNVRGILFTRFNPRANISKQIRELTEQLSEYIHAPIFKTYIRSAVAIEEAQANKADIFDYAKNSTVSADYNAFIEEFLEGEK